MSTSGATVPWSGPSFKGADSFCVMASFAEVWRFSDRRNSKLPHARKGRRAPDIPMPEVRGFTAETVTGFPARDNVRPAALALRVDKIHPVSQEFTPDVDFPRADNDRRRNAWRSWQSRYGI